MRSKLFLLLSLALGGVAALSFVNLPDSAESRVLAQEEETPEERKARRAREAMEAAVTRGRELWDSRELGRKTCASCHEDPEKPDLDFATRKFEYPAFSRRKRGAVTLQQKIQEMIKFQSRGQPLDPDSSDLAALGAYINHVKNGGEK